MNLFLAESAKLIVSILYFQAHDFMSVEDLRKIFQVEHHNDGKFYKEIFISIINII